MNVEIPEDMLLNLLWMARRYADGRSTYSPYVFNECYEYIKRLNLEIIDTETPDETCKFFPYAQDGMYDEKTGYYDARPKVDYS